MDTSAMTGDDIDDDDEITATRWVLDSRFELGALKDIVLPEITKKMLKSRQHQYAPSQYNVYNQRELQMLRECNYFLFDLEIRDVGLIQCMADDLCLFFDIYCAINYLKLAM